MGDDTEAPVGPDLSFVGEGDFPAEFDRVNWGAFGFAPIWAMLYGPWPWLVALIGAIAVPILIDNVVLLFIDSREVYRAVSPVTSAAAAAIGPIFAAAYALFVNKAVWEKRRSAAESGAYPRPILVSQYRKSIRFWTRLFVVVLVLIWGLSIALMLTGNLKFSDILMPGFAEVLLIALFAYDRVRLARRAKAKDGTV